MSRRRIALYGGTFNPIHNGHLVAAASAADILGLDRVVFIPSFSPPHRELAGGTEATHRLEMVRQACEFDKRFEVSDFEVRQAKTSYSIETVEYFLEHEQKGTQIGYLIGTDAFAELDTWKRVDELILICDFFVMNRPGENRSLDEAMPKALIGQYTQVSEATFRSKKESKAVLVPIKGLDISSTEIREKVAAGESVVNLLPKKVVSYIETHRLYGS